MPELIAAYWPYLVIAAVIGIAVAWLAFVATRKTSVATDKRDVLDEGAAPAARNQALIDTPAASAPKAVIEDAEIAPAPVASTPTPAESSGGEADDLTRIKGLGPKLMALLQTQGITRFEQIANWDDTEIDRIDAMLGRFQGRIRRDSWVEQAKLLASDDATAFADKFGKNQ